MTRLEIRNLVIQNVGRTDKNDLINTLIDLGLVEIAKKHVFSDLELESDLSIDADDYSVALPAAGYTLLSVVVLDPASPDNGYPMEILDKQDFIPFHPRLSEETSGEPVQGYVEGNILYFGAPATGARTFAVTMYRMPIALASDSTENPIKTSDTALASWVTSMTFMALEQFDSSSFWLQRFHSVDLPGLIEADRRKSAVQRVRRGYGEVPPRGFQSDFRRMTAFNKREARW